MSSKGGIYFKNIPPKGVDYFENMSPNGAIFQTISPKGVNILRAGPSKGWIILKTFPPRR